MKTPAIISLFMGLTLLSGCDRAPQVTIVNQSSAELTNVVVSGTGFSEAIGPIPAGAERQISVRPQGESGLKLDFVANNRQFSSAPQGYFENNPSYKVTATVAPDFTVKVDSRL
jgi:hypothetical protein